MQSAWKVGLFVVGFVGLMVGAYAVLRANIFAPETDTYYAAFQDAGGLTVGSAVLYSGVKIGEVEGVSLSETGGAIVTLSLERKTRVPQGTTAILPSSFISIGDRQVLLKPPPQALAYYAPNNADSPIPGTLQGPLDSVFPDSAKTIEELNKTMVAFQELLGDKELKGGLVNLMKSTSNTMVEGQNTAKEFGKLANSLNGVVAKNAGQVSQMLSSMSASLENLQAISLKMKQVATDGKLEAQANELLATITSAAKEGETLVKNLSDVTGDPELKASMKGTLQNFESMSQSGVRIASDAEIMAKNGVEISEQTKELLKKANKLTDEVSKGLEDLKGTVAGLMESKKGGLIPDISVEADLVRETRPGRFRNDINAKLPIGKENLIVGMYDVFESNKLNMQLERPINGKTDLRYGVYASKPGVGVSYALAPNLTLRSDLFGLNNTQWDVRLKYDFKTGLYGWVGVERMLRQNSLAIGIGIKR